MEGMEIHQGERRPIHHGRIDRSGRIALPGPLRSRLSIREGDELLIEEEDDGIHLLTLAQAVKRTQDLVAAHVPPGISLVDGLIAERRAEAARE